MLSPYEEFSLLLLVAAGVGLLSTRLRQPLIIAYILVGILVGPAVFGWVSAHDSIDLLAQIGITVLLFLVGLKLDVHIVRRLGFVALATGIGQLLFTITLGYLISLALGMSPVTALYVAVALTFSSTIIIVKLLSDKREIDSLHGKIAMGFLIVQDIAVVLAMALIGTAGPGAEQGWLLVLLVMLAKGAGLLLALAILMKFVLPYVMKWVAASRELLVLFAVAWGTGLAVLGETLGFSKEVGAFLAGFSLASSPFRDALSGRLTSLRDFLLLFFFIDLGARLDLSGLGSQVPEASILSAFVLIGNPLIVMTIMGLMGYRKRTGFLAGLTVAQISEFSIIFVAMGISLGHVGDDALSLVTLVGLTTIALSTYMILYSHRLYEVLKPALGLFERRVPHRESAYETDGVTEEVPDIIILGVGDYGRRLGANLVRRDLRVLGVDFDPQVLDSAETIGFPIKFGDADDDDLLASLPVSSARWIISTFPQTTVSAHVVQYFRSHGYAGRIAVTAREGSKRDSFSDIEADLVLAPFSDSAELASEAIVNNVQDQTGAGIARTEIRSDASS